MDEFDKRVMRALTEEGEHAEYFKRLLNKGMPKDDTAITPIYIKDASDSCKIIMSEEVFQKLREIRRYSFLHNVEVPFFLFGVEANHGMIFFNKAGYATIGLEQYYANFKSLSHAITDAMEEYLIANDAVNSFPFNNERRNGKYRRAVRCYGHTHPPKGGGDRFTFADLSCVVEHALLNQYFASGEMESLDVLINPSGDVNFIKYESNELLACFMKYRQVYVKMNDGKIARLYAYEKGRYDPYPV